MGQQRVLTLIVADVQDPVTPVFEAPLVGEGYARTRVALSRASRGPPTIVPRCRTKTFFALSNGNISGSCSVSFEGDWQHLHFSRQSALVRATIRRTKVDAGDRKLTSSTHERNEDHLRTPRIFIVREHGLTDALRVSKIMESIDHGNSSKPVFRSPSNVTRACLPSVTD